MAACIAITFLLTVETTEIQISHISIKSERLAKLLRGITVVHLSDLHIGRLGGQDKKVLAMLQDINPDIIFLTGDYISWKGETAGALEFLSRLRARIGTWGVMGDYDYSRTRASCIFCHRDGTGAPSTAHQVRFLKDSVEIIDLPLGQLSIAGIDGEGGGVMRDPRHPEPSLTEQADIILSHNPMLFDQLNSDRGSVVLAGDTHGGQVPLPAVLFRFLGYDKNARYNQGQFQKGRNRMYVNRGIGTSHVPVRLLRRPEVAVLHFTD